MLDRLGARCCRATKTLLELRGAVLTVSDTYIPLLLVRAEPVLLLSSVSDLLVWLLALPSNGGRSIDALTTTLFRAHPRCRARADMTPTLAYFRGRTQDQRRGAC